MLTQKEKKLIIQQTNLPEEHQNMIIDVSEKISDSLNSVKDKHDISEEALSRMVEVFSKCNFPKILDEKSTQLEMMMEDDNEQALSKLMFWVFSETMFRFVEKNGGDVNLARETSDLVNDAFPFLYNLEQENSEIMDSLGFGFGAFPEFDE